MLDVVVVDYHTPDLLREFIDSYDRFAPPGATLTIVMVDYGREDEQSTGSVRTIWIADNCGYAHACNVGAEGGTNDVVLLANADTLLTEGLTECCEALMAHEDWGVLGPRQVDENGRITCGGIFGTDESISQRGWQEFDHGQYSSVRDDAKSVSGSLYFVKRKVWQELTDCPVMQEFQPDSQGAFIHTPHYYEETCCSYHARAHGYKIVFYGPVQMIHYWHKAHQIGSWADQPTTVEGSKQMMREFCALHSIQCE